MDWDDVGRSSYRVEISGWDSGEIFFVEKAYLKWDPEGGKEACVQNLLKQGSVVFIRLLQPLSTHHTYPIAYHVMEVGTRDARGSIRVVLEQARPRPPLSVYRLIAERMR
jgi:hypothetical protein